MAKKTGRSGVRKTVKKKPSRPAKRLARKSAPKTTVKKQATRKAAKPVKKPAMKPKIVKSPRPPMEPETAAVSTVAEQRVGLVTHYYTHLSVAVVKLDQGTLQLGDSIHIKGHTTDFHQTVGSMQIEHQTIQKAGIGEEFGLKVSEHVRNNDVVYKGL